jgi:hypothetical protein
MGDCWEGIRRPERAASHPLGEVQGAGPINVRRVCERAQFILPSEGGSST